MKIARFDPAPCGFPKPRISPLPHRIQFRPCGCWQAVFAQRKRKGLFRSFTRGRYALAEAYRLAGLTRETTLLAPAYHCLTMLDPAVNMGANVLLYPLRPDLSPDLDKLDQIARDSTHPLKALLATHFFGVPQNFDDLKLWCDERGIVLIEDCSHVLFTEDYQATGTGIFGKFVVASPYKFFACEDGGLLYAPDDRLLEGTKTRSAGLIEEIRGIKRTIEKNRFSAAASTLHTEVDGINERLTLLSQGRPTPSELQLAQYEEPSPFFSASAARTSALHSSRWLVHLAPTESTARQRRKNYRRWLDAVAGLPNCRPLYPDLPEECVPYMFPLYIEYPESHFYLLKHLGVPIWRWDELAVSSCLTAHDYRLHLLHLPCHQSLTGSQMDWMIAAMQKTLRRPGPESRRGAM